MIGRGVFANPFCFTDHQPSREDLFDLLNYHLDLFDQHQPRKFNPLKRFFKIYVKDFAGAAELRAQLMTAKNTAEVREIIGRAPL
jgi:tRNA-dihydrouridine synthase